MKNNQKFPYPKGSEWRKWDLHMHTPASFHYDYHGGDAFDKIIEKMNQSDIAVFAITDYFTLEGYKELRKRKDKITKTVFPGIELRLEDSLLPSRHTRNKDKGKSDIPINVQIIFDNDEDIFSRIEEYVFSLEFKDFHNQTNALKKENIIKLGKQINSQLNDQEAYIAGCKRVRIPKEKIKEVLKEKGLSGRALIILPYEKYGGMDPIDPDNDSLIKSRLTKLCNIIESSKESQIEFFLGHSPKLPFILEEGSKNEQFITYIGRPKPCLVGSDSHHPDTVGTFSGNKQCWIKADPVFEGLQQIVYEPSARVYIGEEPPTKLEASKIIKSISIKNSNCWFEDGSLELNQDMISVIGGKGSGKTALLDLIAFSANQEWKEIEGPNSFLPRVKGKIPQLSLILTWSDGSTDNVSLRTYKHQERKKKVIYLSQGFISKLCSEEGSQDLQNQIESVIFQKIEETDKGIYPNFQTYKESRLKIARIALESIQEQLKEIVKEIQGKFALVTEESSIEKDLELKSKDLKEIKKETKKLSDFLLDARKTKQYEGYKNLNERKSVYEKKIAKEREKVRNIDVILELISSFEKKAASFVEDINKKLEEIGVKEQITIAINPKNVIQLINGHRTRIIDSIKKSEEALKKIQLEMQRIISKLKLEKTRENKLIELNKLEKQLGEQIESLKMKSESIKKAKKEIDPLLDRAIETFFRFFILIREGRTILKEIYKPLDSVLKESKEEHERFFSFDVSLDFDSSKMVEMIDQYIDHRKEGKYYNQTGEQIKQDLINIANKTIDLFDWQVIKDNPEQQESIDKRNNKKVRDFIFEIRSLFVDYRRETTEIGEQKIAEQLKDDFSIEDFYNWLFDISYYKLSYSIQFNNKRLDDLSPGLKGVALLILYLELDDEDLKPIIIDQPEENLDNRFIFSTLVGYFRKAKLKRQVIIVTHNANLVVNTDSEQIIVANYDKDKSDQPSIISYVSGALEYSFTDKREKSILFSKGIRQHCWDILEGGPDAFRKREEKYNFPM